MKEKIKILEKFNKIRMDNEEHVVWQYLHDLTLEHNKLKKRIDWLEQKLK